MSNRFTNITRNDIVNLYSLYKSGEYSVFFRHFDDFLNLEEFTQFVLSKKWLVTGEGFISLDIYPKPKLCHISIIIIKEYQRMNIGLNTMLDLGKYLFSNGIDRVVVTVVEDDEHTKNMCEKGGFIKEGTYINSCKYDKIHNEIRYGLSKDRFIELYGG